MRERKEKGVEEQERLAGMKGYMKVWIGCTLANVP